MGVDGLEAIVAEYAALEASLADPPVHRDFRLARRLRRCLEALEPLHTDATRLQGLREDLRDARALARAGEPAWTAEAERFARLAASLEADIAGRLAARDRYDPYDVIVLIEPESGDAGCARALAAACRRRARDEGHRVERLLAEPPPGTEAFAIIAGETGPGAWTAWKHENGPHHVHLAPRPPPTETDRPTAAESAGSAVAEAAMPRAAEREGVARVIVLPDAGSPVEPEDLRVDAYCTRRPGAPAVLRVVHLPTGVVAHGIDPSARRARDNAARVVSARLAAAEIDPGEPAARFLAPRSDTVREHRLT